MKLTWIEWLASLVNDVKPDVIIVAGDWYDMTSLSSYDAGKKSSELRRIMRDNTAGNAALALLESKMKHKPRKKIFLIGNHEQRIERFVEENARLEHLLGYHLFHFAERGWRMVPFLQPISVDGVSYCHFFPRSAAGSVVQTRMGAPNARQQAMREGQSSTAGHQQGLDYSCLPRGRGTVQSIIAGSCYLHDEAYLSPQGNHHWRGVIVKRNVRDGRYSPEFIWIDHLRERYRVAPRSLVRRTRKRIKRH